MPLNKIIAIAFVVGGTLGLIYGGFSFIKESHDIDLGVVCVSVDETEYVSVPVWAEIAGIVIGASMLLLNKRS
jgi:membrane associated rhomboid family serine protease